MAETTAPSTGPDERLVRLGLLSRLLVRPDIGAFLGAIAVFVAFSYFARGVNWIGDPGIAAGWTDQAAQYGSSMFCKTILSKTNSDYLLLRHSYNGRNHPVADA